MCAQQITRQEKSWFQLGLENREILETIFQCGKSLKKLEILILEKILKTSREICWPEKVGTMEMCMTTSIQENKFTVNWP